MPRRHLPGRGRILRCIYQTPPDYVLMFAIGPVTAILTVIAVVTVARRSGEPGWNAVLPAQLMAGAAAILLAYPALAQLAAYKATCTCRCTGNSA